MLYACAYAEEDVGQVASLYLVRATGEANTFAIRVLSEGRHAVRFDEEDIIVSDWWPHSNGYANARCRPVLIADRSTPLFNLRRAYLWLWENPQPDQPLAKLRIRGPSRRGCALLFMALSVRSES